MTVRQWITMLASFAFAYLGVATVGQNPSTLTFDWLAIITAITAIGIAQPDMASASVFRQIATAIGAFIVGYGGVEVSAGYRYALSFNLVGVMMGIGASGLIHSNNPNVTQPLQAMLGIKPKS